MTRRGTSNTNDRGSAQARRERKAWLLSPQAGFGGDGEQVRCQFDGCETMVTMDTITVDRYPVPGICGGRYTRDNIRPACGPHNSAGGAELARDRARMAGVLTVPTRGVSVIVMTEDEQGETLENWTMGVQRYQRSGTMAKRQWRWGASVSVGSVHQWLGGYSTKAEATKAAQALLRQHGITTPE